MKRPVKSTIAFLLTAILLISFGTACRTEENRQDPVSSPSAAETKIPEEAVVSIELTKVPYTEDYVSAPTPTDTPAPTDTATPGPTYTAEPNPYVGVWTIEDLPFSLELRSDATCLITVLENEKEGTYTFNANSITIFVPDDRTVTFQYYAKADTLKIGEFKLIRDDLVFYFDIEGVPVSFQNENDDIAVKVRGAVVEAIGRNGKQIRSYCFTAEGLSPGDESRDWFDADEPYSASDTVHAFKYDGNYLLWTIDADGNPMQPIEVTVNSGFRYPIGEDGIDFLHRSLRSFLRGRNTSTDELNRSISRDVIAAGLYTRAGTVTAGVSLLSTLSKYGYSIGFQESGKYQARHHWGVNPHWGDKLTTADGEEDPDADLNSVSAYTGMSDEACIVWSYKQAGMNLAADTDTLITELGEREDELDNRIEKDRAKSGDIIEQNGRHSMVVDRLDTDKDGADDAYLTFLMGSQILTMQILPFKQIRENEVYSMDAVFADSGRNVDRIRFWENTFRIPTQEMPLYMLETIESEKTQQSFMDLITQLGF